MANSPIEALDLIGEDYAADLEIFWKSYLKRIAFDFACHRAHERQANPFVVLDWRQNQRRSSTCLFMAGLGIQGDPDQITALRDFVPGYHSSDPTASP